MCDAKLVVEIRIHAFQVTCQACDTRAVLPAADCHHQGLLQTWVQQHHAPVLTGLVATSAGRPLPTALSRPHRLR